MNSNFIEVCGHKLEYQLIAAHQLNRPTLVFLHEGLGSLAMWRDFPARVAATTGCRTLVYSRYGYGLSDLLQAPFTVRYMHDEGLVVLPELLDKLDIDNPVLIGHSDGGSISLIHAGGTRRPVGGMILMAPHVFVEDITVASIAQAKVVFETTDLPQKLAKYHADVNSTFWGWNNIWLHPDFRAWNIEEYLLKVSCPVLAIQGVDDEYGTVAQVEAIRDQVPTDVDFLELADCRHSPHRDQIEATLDAMASFVANLS